MIEFEATRYIYKSTFEEAKSTIFMSFWSKSIRNENEESPIYKKQNSQTSVEKENADSEAQANDRSLLKSKFGNDQNFGKPPKLGGHRGVTKSGGGN